MFHDQARRTRVFGRFGVIALLISVMAVLGGCEVMRPIGEATVGGLETAGKATVGGLETAGKATVGGLETAGRATVGGLQWVADGGETGIRGRMHGSTEQPFFLVTGLRFPGIKLSELSVLSMQVVDAGGNKLAWRQGAWTKSKYGPAMTITVTPEKTTRLVKVTGVLIYRGGRWTLSAISVRLPGGSETDEGQLWRTELIRVTRQ